MPLFSEHRSHKRPSINFEVRQDLGFKEAFIRIFEVESLSGTEVYFESDLIALGLSELGQA